MTPRHDWTLIFIHIPKTAGTSLRQAMASAYKPSERLYLYDAPQLEGAMLRSDFVRLPVERRAELRFVMGHFAFGLHREIPRESRYVVVLRDPVERVVSHYYHYRQVVDPGKTGRPARERRLIESQNVTLEEWAFDLQRLEADNQLVRHICGRPEVPYGSCSEEMLDLALQNIDEHFEFVMFADSMAEGAMALGGKLGYVISMEKRANVNEQRPGMDHLDRRVLDRIRELNRFDVALYERMQQRRLTAAGQRGSRRWPWS